MYSQPLLLLLASLIADNSVFACVHGLASEAGYAVRKRSPRPETFVNVKRAQTTPVAITNVRYFNGSGLSAPSTVQFSNGVITAVDTGTDTIPAGAQVFDGTGDTLLPGFIESHSHPTNMEELQTLTSFGITTVMGMGCPYYDNCNALRNQTGMADFYSAGYVGCSPGSLHSVVTALPPQDLIYDPAQADSWVQARISEGSNFIKLIAEDPGLTTAEHTAFVAAAHTYGKKSATHAAQLDNYQQAITSMTDFIQHAPLDGVLTPAQVNTILSQGQVVTPTLAILRNLAMSPANPTNGSYANAEQCVTVLHQAGVPILCGTDSDDVLAIYETKFGSSFYDELENLVAAGLSPVEALNSATSRPAQIFGFTDRGTIAVGQRADLILVQGDPTTNVSNARNIQDVWVTGIQITPVMVPYTALTTVPIGV